MDDPLENGVLSDDDRAGGAGDDDADDDDATNTADDEAGGAGDGGAGDEDDTDADRVSVEDLGLPMPVLREDAALELLAGGELAIVGQLWVSSNSAMLCVVSSGGLEAACIYKPVAGERPLRDFPDGTLARREVAAFLVSRASGWGIVPPTVLRDGPFGPGMVQLWIRSDGQTDPVELVVASDPRLRRIAVFDAAVNNTDRKAGHLVPVPGGHIYGVDHGVTFSPVPKLRTVLWEWRGQPFDGPELAVLGALRAGLDATLGDDLRTLLDPIEVSATARRIDRLLLAGVFPQPDPPLARDALATGLTTPPAAAYQRAGVPLRSPMGHDGHMRRWNGWGDEADDTHVGGTGHRFLGKALGPGTPPRDATLAQVVAAVPPSRLADSGDPLLSTDPELRVRRARGQSFPDLIALRSGRLDAVPDAVARPTSNADVRHVIDIAREHASRLIPYGGGTSVVGGVTARPSRDPLVTVDLAGLNAVSGVDERSGLATVGAGITGPDLATELAARGLTIGHEPQSWELATVGGWVAARGSGLKSLGVGRIEQLYAGGTLEAPAGTLDMAPHPASAAGPDLRQLVLGSEGRLGFLTDVILRATPLPEMERMEAWALPGWGEGQEAVRELVQARSGLSLLRLSTPAETQTLLAFADRPSQTRVLTTYLRVRRRPSDWVLLLVGVSGRRRIAKASAAEAGSVLRKHHGTRIPSLATTWYRTRFRSPYLRNALWSAGYGSDTLETATDWSHVPLLLARLEASLAGALAPFGERAHVFTHLSHLYPSGSSLYVTYLFRLAADPDETLARWQALKRAASDTISTEGATITHHHGVGTDHASYLAAEKGPLGMAALQSIVRTFDPEGLMNPGVLLSDRHG